ncbi:serine/arginine repetitive matrix protein 2-like [Mya arenaria]|uniref:serine/arginine repetitive matrix protein 2-like n=1 Tax=Mya arenaria TaxID=6604 RepID=UPI0022E83AEE|nr:serine/arginine repetitive matrix protein 2-like [Mya arenaria]
MKRNKYLRHRQQSYECPGKRSIFDIFWEKINAPLGSENHCVTETSIGSHFEELISGVKILTSCSSINVENCGHAAEHWNQSNGLGVPLGCFNVYLAKPTHQIAEATAEKNARLKEAFGISDYYQDGSSFDPNKKTKEDAAKALAMAHKKYAIEKDSDSEPENSPGPAIRKRKKKSRDKSESSPERKSSKKKKSKKHRHDRSVSRKSKKRKHKHKKSDSPSKKRKHRRRSVSSSSCSSSDDSSNESEHEPSSRSKPDQDRSQSRRSHSRSNSPEERRPRQEVRHRSESLSSQSPSQSPGRGRSPSPSDKCSSRRSDSPSRGSSRHGRESRSPKQQRSRSDSRERRSSMRDRLGSDSRSRSRDRESWSPSIRRRKGSPSHLERRRITRAKQTHQIVEATAEKNARLKEALGIRDYYQDGSSFDPNITTKKDAAKALAIA